MSTNMSFNGPVLEIFSWFPAQTIYKFSLVSKQSKELLSDHIFISKQCRNMESRGDSNLFIQSNIAQGHKATVEIKSLDYNSSCVVPCDSVEFLSNRGRILGSSNGLICCTDVGTNEKVMFICNPATQTWKSISLPDCLRDPNRDIRVLFECNSGSSGNFPQDYKLMTLLVDLNDWGSNMLTVISYSGEGGLWNEQGKINCGARNILCENPVYNDGMIYYISDNSPYLTKNSPFYWPYILAYDNKNHQSRFLKIPKSARKNLLDVSCKMSIFKWGSAMICLVKYVKGAVTVWVLVDKEIIRWKRILKIRVRAMGLNELNPTVAGLAVLNGCSLIVVTEEKVYRYDLTGQNIEKAEEIGWHGCGRNVLVHPYSSTLRPCGDGGLPLPR